MRYKAHANTSDTADKSVGSDQSPNGRVVSSHAWLHFKAVMEALTIPLCFLFVETASVITVKRDESGTEYRENFKIVMV